MTSAPPAPAPASTRLLAKEAGLQLLRSGQRPTAERIRHLIGQGAQQTILSALDDLWVEVGERLRDPRLPPALIDPVTALWSAAVSEAGAQWAQARAALEAERDAAAEERASLRAAVAASEQARQALVARGEAQAQALTEAQEALAAAHRARRALDEALAGQRAATAAAEKAHQDLGERFDREQERTAQEIDQERQARRQAESARDALVRETETRRRENHVLEVNLSRTEQQVAGLQAQLQGRERDWQRVVDDNLRLQEAGRQADRAIQAAQNELRRGQEQWAVDKQARTQLEGQVARAAAVRQELEERVAKGAEARLTLTAELAALRQDVAVLTLAREHAERERDEARRLQETVMQLALAAVPAGVKAAGVGRGEREEGMQGAD